MYATHPFRVTLGEVIVNRDNVDTLSGNCIEVRRQRGHKCFAFARAHLSDVSQMQCCTTHDLYVVVALAQCALGCFAHRGESLRHEVIEGFALRIALLEFLGQGAKFFIGEVHEILLDRINRTSNSFEFAERLSLTRAKDFVENTHVETLQK